jgi:hypothetical protein
MNSPLIPAENTLPRHAISIAANDPSWNLSLPIAPTAPAIL